jgi:hypothetical protein
MSRRRNWLILSLAPIALIVSATSVILISRASTKTPERPLERPAQPRKTSKNRNLSLKPEALAVGRQLGNRFKSQSQSVSTAVGTLTVGGERHQLMLTRRQTTSGEEVEVQIGDRGLKWNEQENLRGQSGPLSDEDRLLAERLILDSPDQFVLAQLRGAGYFTVVRNVRPDDAGDDYSGPLWNVVRVDEPQPQDGNVQLFSSWRLYYINTQTGLPDRIEYQLNGQDIRTDFVEWTEQDGEKTPARVTWSSGGQVIMEYTARHVSHNQ